MVISSISNWLVGGFEFRFDCPPPLQDLDRCFFGSAFFGEGFFFTSTEKPTAKAPEKMGGRLEDDFFFVSGEGKAWLVSRGNLTTFSRCHLFAQASGFFQMLARNFPTQQKSVGQDFFL